LARQQLKPVQNATHNARWKAIKERFAAQTTQIIEGFYEGQSTATVIPQGAPKSKKSRRLRKENPPGTTSGDTNEVSGSINPSIIDAELQHKKVEGMFTGKAGLANNWRMHFTSLVNGTGYQHPHADAGFPDSYKGLKIFPFVTIHGFGLDPFSMWLLPEPFSNTNKYGFMHTFKASQILLMRGDFVHAGVPSTVPRGHMAFYPQPEAGWKRESTFWNRKSWEKVTFMWQGAHPPFGYPCVSSPDQSGSHLVTYPVVYTTLLRYPYSEAECQVLGIPYVRQTEEEKAERTALKRKVVAQLAYGVYNV
jgi:hypothetical protein